MLVRGRLARVTYVRHACWSGPRWLAKAPHSPHELMLARDSQTGSLDRRHVHGRIGAQGSWKTCKITGRIGFCQHWITHEIIIDFRILQWWHFSILISHAAILLSCPIGPWKFAQSQCVAHCYFICSLGVVCSWLLGAVAAVCAPALSAVLSLPWCSSIEFRALSQYKRPSFQVWGFPC